MDLKFTVETTNSIVNKLGLKIYDSDVITSKFMRFLSENDVGKMRVDTRACTQITSPCVFLRINISASFLIIKICLVHILKIKTYQTTFMQFE